MSALHGGVHAEEEAGKEVNPRLPLFVPCPHVKGDLAGGVCASCWEERASALHQDFLELKKLNDSISVCGKHLKDITKGGCVICKSESGREVQTYLTQVVQRAAEALDAQTDGDPRADKMLEVALEGIIKAGEFIEKQKRPAKKT